MVSINILAKIKACAGIDDCIARIDLRSLPNCVKCYCYLAKLVGVFPPTVVEDYCKEGELQQIL